MNWFKSGSAFTNLQIDKLNLIFNWVSCYWICKILNIKFLQRNFCELVQKWFTYGLWLSVFSVFKVDFRIAWSPFNSLYELVHMWFTDSVGFLWLSVFIYSPSLLEHFLQVNEVPLTCEYIQFPYELVPKWFIISVYSLQIHFPKIWAYTGYF